LNGFFHAFFDLPDMLAVLPSLLTEGLPNTLLIAALAVAVGLSAGLVLASLLLSSRWWVRVWARCYVDVFRGLPAILTVSLVGLGLPAAGVRPFGRDPLGYAVLAVGMISAAYCAEILRAGIQSVPPGQSEAARSLGLSYSAAMRLVVVPQGIRNVLPALTGQFIVDVKESSLVYLLGLAVGQRELFFIASEQQAATYNSSALVAAGVCYLVITVPLTHLVNRLDRRLRRGSARSRRIPRPMPTAAAGTENALEIQV